MESIEVFNHQLNESLQNQREPWEKYRDEVMTIIAKAIKELETTERVLVIGSGNLNDLDVKFLKKHFSSVVLSDIDLGSVEKGLLHQGVSPKEVELVRIDYTSFEKEDFFTGLEQRINLRKSSNELISYLEQTMNSASSTSILKSYKGKCDLIIVLPIYTQLVYGQIQALVGKKIREGYDDFQLQLFLEQSFPLIAKVIDYVNREINELGTKKSRYVVLSDIFEGHPNSSFIQSIVTNQGNQELVDQIHENYVCEYGHGLGDYGLYYFLDYFVTNFTRWLIWPFQSDRTIVVKALIGRKSEEEF